MMDPLCFSSALMALRLHFTLMHLRAYKKYEFGFLALFLWAWQFSPRPRTNSEFSVARSASCGNLPVVRCLPTHRNIHISMYIYISRYTYMYMHHDVAVHFAGL